MEQIARLSPGIIKIQKQSVRSVIREYVVITFAAILMDIGVYVFKFTNHFSFGGVSGMAVLLEELLPMSAAQINLIINMALLVLGFACLGKGFGVKTAYVTVLSSVLLNIFEKVIPLSAPLTDQTMLELVYAIVLPAFAAALFFFENASGGGTDILAMILKKYSTLDTGKALLVSDSLIALSACFIFDIKTGLFSLFGLMLKAFLVDSVIESINLCKYFTIVTTRPQEICDYIMHTIGHSATLVKATGAFSCEEKMLVLTAVKRGEAVHLRQRIREIDPGAFMFIANTSEILGKGVRSSL